MAHKNKTQNGFQTVGALSETLKEEYLHQQFLFDTQPPIIQRFLEVQARTLAEAFTQRSTHVRFLLPDRIRTGPEVEPLIIPESFRHQSVGRFSDRLTRRDSHITLRQRLTELESSNERAVAICAGLLRFSTAQHIIHNMLPAGRSVTYAVPDDEEIPFIPMEGLEPASAITAETDAIAEEGNLEIGRGNLQVPFVPAARRYFLPQWVAFDDVGNLLVNSVDEAQAHVASMQRFLDLLFAARSIAPYVVADEEFEKKRYGMLGQLVNQGRALAWQMTLTIIKTIKERAAAQSLNRGLGIHLPFFDDQDLRIEHHNFIVIPAGRIMFVPAFVVRAAQEEQAKVTQDTRLSYSTRKYLLKELSFLENSFKSPEL